MASCPTHLPSCAGSRPPCPTSRHPAPGRPASRGTPAGRREIWSFLAEDPSVIARGRAKELSTDDALDTLTLLPSVREIRAAEIGADELEDLRSRGPEVVRDALLERATRIAGQLRDGFTGLRPAQVEALSALADGHDVMAILPTSAGKSFIFQLPAFALPGVTIVVSPLVALMTDQALALNHAIGDAVRALVAPMRESNSRTGKAQVADALTNPASRHGIKLVYVSPERLCQRQFQEWILEGVRKGIVTRIAIDEAHTFATWGEDFRPSFKRVERFLARLRAEPKRPRLLALTATATPSVRVRLRHAIFGLDAPDPALLSEVTRNPIRPELALYRRTLAGQEGGPVGKQRLLEAVLDGAPGHTIVYTLTVKEARTIHAALVDHFGEGARDRIRLFHGRLTAAEKEAVARDFANAPHQGDEGFDPAQAMIVVATAAFGLGVDRKDIRAVVVASPPADLAALYQELGRAGRDGQTATGIMLGSGRAWRTLAFMEQLRTKLDPVVYVAGIADRILRGDGPVDMEAVAADVLDEDVALGRRTQAEAAESNALDAYKVLTVRVLAALAAADVIEDRGDFPDVVRVLRRDDVPDPGPDLAPLLDALMTAGGDAKDLDLRHVAAALSGSFDEELADPGDLWVRLLELHSIGYLDVSQQSTKRYLSSIRRLAKVLPADFLAGFVSDVSRDERERLMEFFARRPTPSCVNDDFRAYFDEPDLPPGTCATPDCRCSGCWLAGSGGDDDVRPRLLSALADARLRPGHTVAESRAARARIVSNIERLLRARWGALSRFAIDKTLRGEDRYMNRRSGRMEALWPELVNSAVFGSTPGLRSADLDEALTALIASGRVTLVGDPPGRYRWTGHIRTEAERAAWRASRSTIEAGVGRQPSPWARVSS